MQFTFGIVLLIYYFPRCRPTLNNLAFIHGIYEYLVCCRCLWNYSKPTLPHRNGLEQALAEEHQEKS
jgi:hypothetical protein